MNEFEKQLLEVNKEVAMLFYATLRTKKGEKGMEYFKERKLSNQTLKDFGLGFSNKSGKAMYEYLSKKGFDDEVLKESGIITFDEESGWKNKFWNRAMFPIIDLKGNVIAFGGRVMDDSKPKYLNSPKTAVFDKSSNLYALNKAILSKRPYFILCEGYMDVISLHQAGFDCAVAALGTAYTKEHAAILKRYTNDVYLTFDSDGPGIKAALRAIPMCKEAGLNCKVINMKPYKDPDEFIKNLGKEEFEKRILNAESDIHFEIRTSSDKYNLENLDEKIEFYKEMALKMCALSDKDIQNIINER